VSCLNITLRHNWKEMLLYLNKLKSSEVKPWTNRCMYFPKRIFNLQPLNFIHLQCTISMRIKHNYVDSHCKSYQKTIHNVHHTYELLKHNCNHTIIAISCLHSYKPSIQNVKNLLGLSLNSFEKNLFLNICWGLFWYVFWDLSLGLHHYTESAPIFLIPLAQQRDPQGARQRIKPKTYCTR